MALTGLLSLLGPQPTPPLPTRPTRFRAARTPPATTGNDLEGIASNGDTGAVAGRARAINDGSVGEQQVNHNKSPSLAEPQRASGKAGRPPVGVAGIIYHCGLCVALARMGRGVRHGVADPRFLGGMARRRPVSKTGKMSAESD